MTARRELRLAVLLCLLGSALVLYAVDRTWFSVAEGQQVSIDAVRTVVKGHRIVSGAQALGYVGLAGVVALAATRRTGRVLVGLLVLSAGVGVVVVIARALGAGLSERGVGALRPGGCGVGSGGCLAAFTDPKVSAGWAWLALAGGVLLALSGLLVTVRGRRWAALSSSYSPPAARAVEPPVTDKGVWDALDRGEDPT
jgi:uncharacterized membrane protein (TIGR02234 family)